MGPFRRTSEMIVKLLLIFLLIPCTWSYNPHLKIVGGVNARWNEVPWIVSIRNKRVDRLFGEGHFCGGTLIDNQTVITANHCFVNIKT